jgi:hypothetical protein
MLQEVVRIQPRGQFSGGGDTAGLVPQQVDQFPNTSCALSTGYGPAHRRRPSATSPPTRTVNASPRSTSVRRAVGSSAALAPGADGRTTCRVDHIAVGQERETVRERILAAGELDQGPQSARCRGGPGSQASSAGPDDEDKAPWRREWETIATGTWPHEGHLQLFRPQRP